MSVLNDTLMSHSIGNIDVYIQAKIQYDDQAII